jgi:hypothetical protein
VHREFGIESTLAFRLFAETNTMGALNMYPPSLMFDDHDVAIGAVFATHAVVAMSTSEDIRNIQDAITSRSMIGKAVGLLRGREGVSEQEAFDVLVRASRRPNVKLRLVAEQVVDRQHHPRPLSSGRKHCEPLEPSDLADQDRWRIKQSYPKATGSTGRLISGCNLSASMLARIRAVPSPTKSQQRGRICLL